MAQRSPCACLPCLPQLACCKQGRRQAGSKWRTLFFGGRGGDAQEDHDGAIQATLRVAFSRRSWMGKRELEGWEQDEQVV